MLLGDDFYEHTKFDIMIVFDTDDRNEYGFE